MEKYFYLLITLGCAVETFCYYKRGCRGLAKGEKNEDCIRGVFLLHLFVLCFFVFCTVRDFFIGDFSLIGIAGDITTVDLLLLLDIVPLTYLKNIRYSGFNTLHFKFAIAALAMVTIVSQATISTSFDWLCSSLLSGVFVGSHLFICILIVLVQCRLSCRFGKENMAGILMNTAVLIAFLSVTGLLFTCHFVIHVKEGYSSALIICTAISIHVFHGFQVSCGHPFVKGLENWCRRNIDKEYEGDTHQKILLASESLSVRLSDYFETEKPFLRPDLCLSEVSLYLMTNKTTLSKVLHLNMNTNFREFVNKYRVQEAMSLYSRNMHLDMEKLSRLCGFRNNASFTNAFKLNLGVTPGVWCKNYKDKRNEIWKKELLEDADTYFKDKTSA